MRRMILTSIVVLLCACSSEVNLSGRKSATKLNFDGTLGLKNFRQIAASFSQITQVESTVTAIQTVLNANSAFLSQANKPEEMSLSTNLAIGRIGATYCTQLATAEAAKAPGNRIIYSQVNFTQGPQALSQAVVDDFISKLAVRAWGRQLTSEEQVNLRELALEGGPTGNAAETLNRLLLTCTAVLMSTASIAL